MANLKSEIQNPKLLLHVCCGPCSTHVMELLSPDYDIMPYFYNPNIEPRQEYERRLAAALKACPGLAAGPYDHDAWRQAVAGLADEAEGGERCSVCYRFRLERCVDEARERGATHLASTLSVGPAKKAAEINRVGGAAVSARRLDFLEADFKKKDGFKRSVELSARLGLYRQDYCGCSFSLEARKSQGEK